MFAFRLWDLLWLAHTGWALNIPPAVTECPCIYPYGDAKNTVTAPSLDSCYAYCVVMKCYSFSHQVSNAFRF